MSIKIAFVSLGCDKNLVDSEIMLGIINENGYKIVSDEQEADIIIINTCGFILDATNEGIENVLTLASYKKDGNCKGLIVTGCMAERYRDEIFNELPEVDAVVGTGDFESIVDVIKRVEEGEKVKLVTGNRKLSDTLSHKRMLTTPQHLAFLKIAEGCDNKCTYCTIPSIRGPYVSRSMESIIEEAKILADKGVQELLIIAQDTAIYGKDLYGKSELHTLLNKISEIEQIKWIRILYAYPEHITDELISEIKNNDKICNYLDMPIQHSENDILRKMARASRREDLVELITKIRKEMPDFIFRTTLIVGFPNETEENFNGLVNFVEEMQFDKIGVFTYSKEDGTPAATFDNQIDEDVKEERKDYIMNVQKNVSSRKMDSYIGKQFDVIVDAYIPEEEVYSCRSYMDTYEVDGMIFVTCDYELLSGAELTVEITSASDYDLIGEIID